MGHASGRRDEKSDRSNFGVYAQPQVPVREK